MHCIPVESHIRADGVVVWVLSVYPVERQAIEREREEVNVMSSHSGLIDAMIVEQILFPRDNFNTHSSLRQSRDIDIRRGGNFFLPHHLRRRCSCCC